MLAQICGEYFFKSNLERMHENKTRKTVTARLISPRRDGDCKVGDCAVVIKLVNIRTHWRRTGFHMKRIHYNSGGRPDHVFMQTRLGPTLPTQADVDPDSVESP